jgi:hypothetical protein
MLDMSLWLVIARVKRLGESSMAECGSGQRRRRLFRSIGIGFRCGPPTPGPWASRQLMNRARSSRWSWDLQSAVSRYRRFFSALSEEGKRLWSEPPFGRLRRSSRNAGQPPDSFDYRRPIGAEPCMAESHTAISAPMPSQNPIIGLMPMPVRGTGKAPKKGIAAQTKK